MSFANDNPGAMAYPDAPRRDSSDYTLSVEEASDLFANAGVPRSVRSVQRFCQKGHLDCIPVDTEMGQKYLVSREGVDRRIRELQQIERVMRATGAARRVEARPGAPSHDETRSDAPGHDGVAANRIRELESKVRELEIDKAVRQQLIERLDGDRVRMLDQVERYVTQLIEKSREIGQMETKLMRLSAPQGRDTNESEYHVVDAGTEPESSTETWPHPSAADLADQGDNSARRLNVQGLE